MIKKCVMITVYLMLGYQAKAFYDLPDFSRMPASDKMPAAVTTAKTHSICMIQAGDVGKLKFKAKSYEVAFSKVTDECFQRRNDLFVKNRKMQPDQDRQIQFAESCVNSVKCI